MDAKLLLFTKNGERKAISLLSKMTVIGRRKECELYIPLMLVSRRHCQIIQNSNTLKIRDLDSSNGTFINGTKIDYNERHLEAGDQIQIGPLTFTVQIDGQPENISPPAQLEDIAQQLENNNNNQGDTVLE